MKKRMKPLVNLLLGMLALFFLVPALQVEAQKPRTSYNAVAYNTNGYRYEMLVKGNSRKYSEKAITLIYAKSGCANCNKVLKEAHEVYKSGGSLKIICVMAFSQDNASYLKEKRAAYPEIEFADFRSENQQAAWDVIKKENLHKDLGGGNISTATPLTLIIPNDSNRYVSYVSTGYDSNYKTELIKLAGGGGNSGGNSGGNNGGSGGGNSGGSGSTSVGTWVENSRGWRFRLNGGTYVKSSWKEIDKKWYYFGSDTYMKTGWVKVSNKWYYMNKSGVMQTGWTKIGGKWYYMNKNGVMQTGWTKVGGKWYYMNKSGVMQTGWKQIGGIWYFLNKTGDMRTGWLQSGNKWYYLDSKGMMLANTSRTIGGKTYKFRLDGVCINR